MYAKFSNQQAVLKAIRSSYLGRQNSSVPSEKWEHEISIKEGFNLHPSSILKFL